MGHVYRLVLDGTGQARAVLDRQLVEACYPWGESPYAVDDNDAFAAALGGDE